MWLTPETCRVNLQNNRLLFVASRWTTINIYSSISVDMFSHLNVHVKLGSSGRWRTGEVIEMLDYIAWCSHWFLITDVRHLSKLVGTVWCHIKRHEGRISCRHTYFFCTVFTGPFFFKIFLKILVKLWARVLLSGMFRAQLRTRMLGALTEVFGLLPSISRQCRKVGCFGFSRCAVQPVHVIRFHIGYANKLKLREGQT